MKFNHQINIGRLKKAGLVNFNEVELSYDDSFRTSFPSYKKEILFWVSILEDGRAVKVAYQYYIDGIITLDVVRPDKSEIIELYFKFLRF